MTVQLVPDVPKILNLLEERLETVKKLERAKAVLYKTGNAPITRKKPLIGEKVDAIEWFTAELHRMEEKLENKKKEPLKYTGVAFVSFNSIAGASKCAQLQLHHHPNAWQR